MYSIHAAQDLFKAIKFNDLVNIEKLSLSNGFNLKSFCLGLVAFWTFFFGPVDIMFIVLVSFIFIDYILGLVTAAMHTGISSDVSRRGIIRKMCFLLAVVVGNLLDKAFGTGEFVRKAVTTVLILNETSSILEKFEYMGIKIPVIRNLLAVTRLKKDTEEKNIKKK